MGLGGTAKKLQKVMESAEKLYAKMNEIIGELKSLQREVEDTSEQVDHLERDLAEQRALLNALAEQEGLDVEAILADADLPSDTEADPSATGPGDGDGSSDTTEVPVSDESGPD